MNSEKGLSNFQVGCIPVALVAIWIGSVFLVQTKFSDYYTKPAAPASNNQYWPKGTSIAPAAPDTWTIVIAAHPHCPCTRASVSELNRILALARFKVRTIFLFYRPASSNSSWNKTDLWSSAHDVPGAVLLDDPNGEKSTRFGATVSSELFLYSPKGELRFHGGITGWRGHEGDNDGEDAVVALLNGKKPNSDATPAFGCSLQ